MSTDPINQPPAEAPAAPGVEGQEPTTPPVETPPVEGQEPPQEPLDNPNDPRVKKANAEAAKYRTERNELRDAVEAAKAEQADMVQKIGKAFGFVTDEEEGQADAQKLVEQIAGERDTLQSELKQLRQQNALTTAINGFNVDGNKVPLDNTLTLTVLKGTGALDGLDPADADYSSQVEKALADVVQAHPQLRTQVVPGSSGAAPTPTNNGNAKLTREDLATMSAAEINEAAKDGKLDHLTNPA